MDEARVNVVEPAADGPRFCARCLYDLAAVRGDRCPECGRHFDAADASSFLRQGRRTIEQSRRLRWAVAMLVTLMVVSGFMYTVLPRPARLTDWRLWLWLGRPFGVMHGTSARHEVYAHYWFGREHLREAFRRDDGALAWRVERVREGWYRLQVREALVPASGPLGAFNTMKRPRFFGVGIDMPNKEPEGNDRPFAVEGDDAAVLGALVSEYGIRLRPMRMTAEQDFVWVHDEATRRMVPREVSASEADDYPLAREEGRVLIQRPAGSAAGGGS